MAKSQAKPFNKNNQYNKSNLNRNNNCDNRNHNNQNKKQNSNNNNCQQRVDKPRTNKNKQIPINHNVRGPLFNKSNLSAVWKIKRKIGPGLMNGQNTCFLNAVLECLTYTPPLAQYLAQEPHRKQCRIESGYCALCAMEIHAARCLKDAKSYVNGAAILPSYFTSNLKAISKTLNLGRQEDAHEFYMFLLSAFQKATIAGLGKLSPKVEETALIYQIFGGKLRSQLKCFSCKATSNNYEACLDLSVDLNNNANILEKTFENFIKVDHIEGYKCDSCKQTVKAGKQMTINELPMMLTVHLKRFAFDLRRGCMQKIGTHVDYPETLDMQPYTSKDKQLSQAKYSLYAVLVHYGYGCDSGHYYAYVKAPDGQWYLMDDEDVSRVSVKEVMSQKAYMLFYQQKPTTKAMDIVEEVQPPIQEAKPPAAKKVLVDRSVPLEPKIEKKRVVLEPVITATDPQLWIVQPSDKPFKSLRGQLSPPTYGAAVSHASAWTTTTIDNYLLKQKLNKRRVYRKKLEATKTPWKISLFKK